MKDRVTDEIISDSQYHTTIGVNNTAAVINPCFHEGYETEIIWETSNAPNSNGNDNEGDSDDERGKKSFPYPYTGR